MTRRIGVGVKAWVPFSLTLLGMEPVAQVKLKLLWERGRLDEETCSWFTVFLKRFMGQKNSCLKKDFCCIVGVFLPGPPSFCCVGNLVGCLTSRSVLIPTFHAFSISACQ